MKDALRARHPAVVYQPTGAGPWTCLEEWMNIDLLAGVVTFGVVDRRTEEERRAWYYGSRAKIDHERTYRPTCPTCRGEGWLQEADAVRAGAPRLWVPPDVGLVEVDDRGRVSVVRKAPLRETVGGRFEMSDSDLGQLVRWVSVRPDPRHAELRPDSGRTT